jgi:hypothetical protein
VRALDVGISEHFVSIISGMAGGHRPVFWPGEPRFVESPYIARPVQIKLKDHHEHRPCPASQVKAPGYSLQQVELPKGAVTLARTARSAEVTIRESG